MSGGVPIPASVALPKSEFLGIGQEVKAQLRAIQSAKQAAKVARESSSHAGGAPPTADQLQLDFLTHASDDTPMQDTFDAHVHAAAAAPARSASVAAESTPVRPAQSVGFGDEDFIAFTADETPAGATPAGRGLKRKSLTGTGDDGTESDVDTPAGGRIVVEGAYRAPWARSAYTQPNFTLRLHEEILDFCTYVSPKPEEQQMRAELIQRIEAIAREAFPQAPNVRLKPFGSYATKLYLPISDIDLVLFGADPNHATQPTMDKGKNSALGMLERTMRAKQNATYLEHISGARIPILKFTDKETGVKIDICYEIEGGLKAAEFIVTMQQQMPALRPLTLFLKYFLHCRILNDTYKGGIGSFMLQLMLINHLQDLHYAGRLNHPSTNLGMLLMSFLECYGVSLNYKQAGLNMNAAALAPPPAEEAAASSRRSNSSAASSSSSSGLRTSFFHKSSKGWFNANRPYLLSIENPLDAKHDVGSNSYLILRVRKALQFAFQSLAAHQHYEDLARQRGDNYEQRRKRQRHDLQASVEFPFANAAHTPQTLLSHIVSVNEEIRPGQKELEYEEMEAELTRDQQRKHQRAKQVHVIDSSEDEVEPPKEKSGFKQPSFGEVQLDDDEAEDDDGQVDNNEEEEPEEGEVAASSSSDSDDGDVDASLADGAVDARGDMTRFEKRFGVDGGDDEDDDDSEASGDESDSQSEEGEDDSEEDEDEDAQMDIDVDRAPYDDGELFTTPAGSKRIVKSAERTPSSVHTRQPVPLDEDFIPLSGGGGGHKAQQQGGGGSNNRKKSSSYNFSHTAHGASQHRSTKAHKKQKPMLQGARTDATKPNNQIFESNRSKKKKQSAKKNRKAQTNRKSSH